MKILRILNRLNVGGPTYNVANLSKFLPVEYETKVLAGYKEPDEASSEYLLQELGIDYSFVPSMYRPINRKNDTEAYRYIKQVIETWQPDIVHTHAAKAGALGRLAAHRAKKRPKLLLHTYHGNVFDGYFSPLKTRLILAVERYLCRISDVVIAISETQKKDLSEKYKVVKASKIRVVRLGFELSKFRENMDAKRSGFRSFYQVPDDAVVITMTGRLAPIKNPLLFIGALALLLKQHPSIPVKAFIVGDGEMFNETVAAAKAHGISCALPGDAQPGAQLVFTSWRKDIDCVNAGSDIVVLSSVNEGTPVSIIEAMASGKAVLSTNVGGVGDVIQHGVNGLVSEQNPVAFAAALATMVVDRSLRQQLGQSARESAFANYSYERLAKDMDAVYREALAAKK